MHLHKERPMKKLSMIAAATMLLAGTAIAQDATTRGGAQSSVPSTKQNSPATGAMTAPGANTNTTVQGSASGSTSGSGSMTKEPDSMQRPKTTQPSSQAK
jgi:hypothetical protein